MEALLYWQFKESAPFEREVRSFANQREFIQKIGTTDGTGAFLQLYQEDMPFTSVWAVDAYFLGRCLNGDFMRATISTLFKRISGAAPVRQGVGTLVLSIASGGSMSGDISVSGNGMQVRFSDGGTGIANASVVVCIQEVL